MAEPAVVEEARQALTLLEGSTRRAIAKALRMLRSNEAGSAARRPADGWLLFEWSTLPAEDLSLS